MNDKATDNGEQISFRSNWDLPESIWAFLETLVRTQAVIKPDFAYQSMKKWQFLKQFKVSEQEVNSEVSDKWMQRRVKGKVLELNEPNMKRLRSEQIGIASKS